MGSKRLILGDAQLKKTPSGERIGEGDARWDCAPHSTSPPRGEWNHGAKPRAIVGRPYKQGKHCMQGLTSASSANQALQTTPRQKITKNYDRRSAFFVSSVLGHSTRGVALLPRRKGVRIGTREHKKVIMLSAFDLANTRPGAPAECAVPLQTTATCSAEAVYV